MNHIFVKVFLDQNLGDDLMLLKLAQYFPDTTFYISCPHALQKAYRTLLIETANTVLADTELKDIMSFGTHFFQAIIQIGGSILQGTRNMGCFYRYRNIRTIKKMKKAGVPYFIVGCNTGPFINRLTEYFVKLELRSAAGISTRDKASRDFIEKSVNKKLPVYYGDDILLDSMNFFRIHKKDKGYLGISVFNSGNESFVNERVIKAYATIADRYIERTNKKVVLLALDTGNQNDSLLAEKVLGLMENKDKARIVSYEIGNPLAILQEIASCQYMVAVRFHSMILALSAGVKVFPVIYSNKTENFLDDNGYANKTYLSKLAELDADNLVDTLIEEDQYMLLERQYSSETHFSMLRKMLSI